MHENNPYGQDNPSKSLSVSNNFYKEKGQDNTLLIILGVAVLAFMGFLSYKSIQQQSLIQQQQQAVALQPKTILTDFVRDKEGRIIQILEKG